MPVKVTRPLSGWWGDFLSKYPVGGPDIQMATFVVKHGGVFLLTTPSPTYPTFEFSCIKQAAENKTSFGPKPKDQRNLHKAFT